jgi:hypothetical protein
MTARRIAIVVALTLTLAASWGGGVAAAAARPGTVEAAGTSPSCAQLQERIDHVPALKRRIQNRVDALRSRIARAARPARRARLTALLQPRIDRLQELSRQLAQQVAAAQRRCGTNTT